MSETRIDGPQGALSVDDGGASGDLLPVLFVHSDVGDKAHWSAHLEHLRPLRRALALDLWGHGRSDVPKDGDYSMNGRAEDVAAVVDALGLERFDPTPSLRFYRGPRLSLVTPPSDRRSRVVNREPKKTIRDARFAIRRPSGERNLSRRMPRE